MKSLAIGAACPDPPGGLNVADRPSEQASPLLPGADRKAHEFSRTGASTEHLLLALAGPDVVRTVLGQVKTDLGGPRRQIEREAKKGAAICTPDERW